MTLDPRALVARLRATLHLDDAPWRLALSLAVGVFVSFTPLWGFHTLLCIGIAIVARLNRAATVAGAWLNLPWFAPLIYAAGLKLGGLILADVEGLAHLSAALFLGTTILGVVAGAVTYVVAFSVLQRRRRR